MKINKALWGAIPDPTDKRDLIYEDHIFGKGRPVGMPTFDKGYNAEDKYGKNRDEHQDSSLRCVSEGGTADIETSIIYETGERIQLSQRDAYSQIHGPSGGANPRDFYKLAKGKGICEERFCGSYPTDGSRVTESWTRKRGTMSPERVENALQWRIGAYRSIRSYDMEVIAQAIFENNGCGGAYKPVNSSMGHMIFFKGYGMHKGYIGLRYRDSYAPYDKWIVKHKGKFYYSSTNHPLAVQIQLYSIWTAEPGNWSKKKMIILKRAEDTKKVFAIIGSRRYWINDWQNLDDFIEMFGYKDVKHAQDSVQEVSSDHLKGYSYGGNIGNPTIWDYFIGRNN